MQPSVNPYESPHANSAEPRAVSDSEVRLAYGERLLIAFRDVQPSLHVLMSLAGLALLDFVILTLIIRSTFRVRATRIRDRSVTLTGVAPEFARAYDEYQRTKLDAAVKYVLEGIQ